MASADMAVPSDDLRHLRQPFDWHGHGGRQRRSHEDPCILVAPTRDGAVHPEGTGLLSIGELDGVVEPLDDDGKVVR